MRRRRRARVVPPLTPPPVRATRMMGMMIDAEEEEEALPPPSAPVPTPPLSPLLVAMLLVVSVHASSDGRYPIIVSDGLAAASATGHFGFRARPSSDTADRRRRREIANGVRGGVGSIASSPASLPESEESTARPRTAAVPRATALQADEMDGYPAEAVPPEVEVSSEPPDDHSTAASVVPNTSSGGANYPLRGGATSSTIHTHDTPAASSAGGTLISPTGEVVDHTRNRSGERERRDFYEFVAFVCWYMFLIVCCIVPTVCVYRRRLRREREVLRELEEAQRIGLSVLRMRSSAGSAGGEGGSGRAAQSWSLAVGAVTRGLVPPVTDEWRRKRRALLDEQWERSSMIVTEEALFPERRKISSSPAVPVPRHYGAPEVGGTEGGHEGNGSWATCEGEGEEEEGSGGQRTGDADSASDVERADFIATGNADTAGDGAAVRKCPPSGEGGTIAGGGDGGRAGDASSDDADSPKSELELRSEPPPFKDAGSCDDDTPDDDTPGFADGAGGADLEDPDHEDLDLDGHRPIDVEGGRFVFDDGDEEDEDNADPPPALLHLPAATRGDDDETGLLPQPLVNGGPRSVPNSCAICLCPYEVGCTVTWSSIVAPSEGAMDDDDGGGGDGDGDGATSSPSSAAASIPSHTPPTPPKCPHAFHRSCIAAWCVRKMEEDPTSGVCLCPCCRQEFVRLDADASSSLSSSPVIGRASSSAARLASASAARSLTYAR